MKESSVKSVSYKPIVIIISAIFLTSIVFGIRDYIHYIFSFKTMIGYFMIGFFLVFGTFKLLDLKGFANGYSMYDLLAKRWYSYGYIYPFIEIFFGILMIINPNSVPVLIVEIFVMVFSGTGVYLKMLSKEKFECACLGTIFKIPLTKVTLIEDFGMAFLAFILLLL